MPELPVDLNYIDCKLTLLDEEKLEYVDYYHPEKIPGNVSKNDLIGNTIRGFKNLVANYECCRRPVLEILGEHLYNFLFESPEIKKTFENTYKVFNDQKKRQPNLRLRLILIFHEEAKDLTTYPWEFIYMPWKQIGLSRDNTGFFLAGEETGLILTRFVPELEVRRFEREKSPLRILIVFSHPKDLGFVDDEIINDIKELKNLQKPDYIKVESMENPTFTSLKEKIDACRPHILHFIGHGEDGQIALINEKEEIELQEAEKGQGKAKEAKWIDSRTVGTLFNKYQPRLVFLHACKGATSQSIQNSLRSISSTARWLVYKNIPAVIAMQYEISNEDALIFARKFYQQIGQGMPIDEAVTEARKELGNTPRGGRLAWDSRSFGTPVVYLQTSEAIILPSEKGEKKEPGNGDSSETIRCPKCTRLILSKFKKCIHPDCYCIFMKCPKCQELVCEDFGICPMCGYDWSRRGAESGTGEFKRLPPDRISQAPGILGDVAGQRKKGEFG